MQPRNNSLYLMMVFLAYSLDQTFVYNVSLGSVAGQRIPMPVFVQLGQQMINSGVDLLTSKNPERSANEPCLQLSKEAVDTGMIQVLSSTPSSGFT